MYMNILERFKKGVFKKKYKNILECYCYKIDGLYEI